MIIFDREEAIEAALEKRKFLFKRLLKDYTFTDSDQWRGGRGGQGPWPPQRRFQEGRQNASGVQKLQRTAWLVFRI